MATITVMKNYVIKKAQGTSDDNLKKIVKVLKNYNKLDVESKKKVGSAVEKLYTKFKAQESKTSTPKAGTTPKSTGKKKLSTQDLKSAIAKFKEKVGTKTWKQATSGTSIKEDAERPALPKGKRYSKITGEPYWENRANRSDVKQPPKTYPRLANGGQAGEWFNKGVGKNGLEKIKNHSKENPKVLFLVTDDNYSNIGSFYLLNGKFAKKTVSNASYDLDRNVVRLTPKSDVIYKMKELGSPNGYYAKGGEVENEEPNYWEATIKNLDGSISYEGIIADNKGDAEYYAELTDSVKDGGKVLSVKHIKKFAKGGIVEHGLKIGDKIIDTYQNDIFIQNNGEMFMVNLNNGTRVKTK